MPILETGSEVKVTVTRKWNGTIRHSKMHPYTKLPSEIHLHTKFGIPTSKNIRDVLQTQQFLKLCQRSGQGHGDSKMVRDTLPSLYAFTHQILNSYLKEYRRYASDSKQFLETRPEVEVYVTGT